MAWQPVRAAPPRLPCVALGTGGHPTGDMTMRPGFYGTSMTGNENIYAYPVKQADGTMSVRVVSQNDPTAQAPAEITLTLPTQAATGAMTQKARASFESEDTTRIGGQESNGEPLEAQGKIPGFNAGGQTFTIALNSGTATIRNFTF